MTPAHPPRNYAAAEMPMLPAHARRRIAASTGEDDPDTVHTPIARPSERPVRAPAIGEPAPIGGPSEDDRSTADPSIPQPVVGSSRRTIRTPASHRVAQFAPINTP